MILKSNFYELLHHPKVVETYNNYLRLSNFEFSNMNYIGINFDEKGICSVKFYFAFFHWLKEEDILSFIPHTDDFNKYYHLWEEHNRSLEHTGCTFEVKFKGSLTPSLGFHYRLKPIQEAYDLIGLPNQISFDAMSLNTRPGINYEYLPDAVLRKKYYYFEKQEHKDYIAERFKKPYAKKASLIEYTESELFSKVNIWKFDYSKENLSRPNYFNEADIELIKELHNKYGLISVSDGFYENNQVKATYFFNTLNNKSIAPFDKEENFNIDTLKLFI